MGMNRISFNVENFSKEMAVGPLVVAKYILVKNTVVTSSANTSAFTGCAEKPKVGLAALSVTAFAVVFAFLLGS